MCNLKEMIRETSYEKGFDPTETIKAYHFDPVQSQGFYNYTYSGTA